MKKHKTKLFYKDVNGKDTHLIAEGDSEAQAAENTIKEYKILQDLHADGDCYDADDRSYIIRVNKELSEQDLLTTIFHEFVHIKQHIKKEFGGDIFAISNDKVAYEDRPYEIEAFRLEKKLLEEYNNVT